MSVRGEEDMVLSTSVLRLPRQYDASDFLQACSLKEQYRILASICRSESHHPLRCSAGDGGSNSSSTRRGDGCVNATEKAEQQQQQQHDGVSDVYYSARLLAFISGCGQETGTLNVLKKEHLRQHRQREQEEAEAAERARLAQEAAAAAEADGEEAANQEIWYDEEGGYYYDSYGYYDEEGNYYYFEGADPGEQAGQEVEVANKETGAQAQEAESEGVACEFQGESEAEPPSCCEDAFATELSHSVSDDAEAELVTTLRVVPDESRLALPPLFRGVCALERAFQVLEQSFPSVNAFLRDNGLFPSVPVCGVANSGTARVEAVEKVRPECIHVVASRQHLHIVYVPTPFANGRGQHAEDEAREKLDAVAPLLDPTTQAGVLVSVPLQNWGGNYTTCYGGLGDGRVLLEVHAAPAEEAGTAVDGTGMTLSMIFGVSPDAPFRAAPLAYRLVACYEQRVLHHLAKSGGKLDDLLLAKFGNENGGSPCASDALRPLFGYSALLLGGDAENKSCSTNGAKCMDELVYHEASNSVFLNKEREKKEQEERQWEEALYLARNLEPPHWRFLREALEKVQQQEVEEREKLIADAWARYRGGHQLSFHGIAFVMLPFLRTQEVSMAELKETEQREWERLLQRFSDRHRRLSAEETRRRLDEQFAFERRLQLLQCSVGFDVLVEREKAMRAMVERDEVLERHGGELQECLLALLICRRTEDARQTTPVKEESVLVAAGCGEKGALTQTEERLGRAVSRSQDSQQPRHALSHSMQSPTTEDFMRMLAHGRRGSPALLPHAATAATLTFHGVMPR
ncbi:uncharacterized protein Tco025E_04901 [Trypanosoma conorhini]|uniref:Uncharacterized protein n=1 Tax=Trypanosoma conorhini TaxID=83891 RepID=A0A422PHK4_9TRYP|nr:uncharacterized protein Tco025E_04901 [Trypanosoma conorhini]RNF17199.1 hypothetical protein Tco025E_04901 [Trypanosoma conorhini]